MGRRHNRHFCRDDNLIRCSGTSLQQQFKGMQCSNWGKPDAQGSYWCHLHKSQAPTS